MRDAGLLELMSVQLVETKHTVASYNIMDLMEVFPLPDAPINST